MSERSFTHVELNNTQNVEQLAKLLDIPVVDVLKERKMRLKERLAKIELPPNMHWVPSGKQLQRLMARARLGVTAETSTTETTRLVG